jgi:hypothetical protein
MGCPAPRQQVTHYSETEQTHREEVRSLAADIRRGHIPKDTCEGRLLLEYSIQGNAYVRLVLS